MNIPHLMRAALVPEPGGPDAFRIDQIETPAPGAGEVLIKVAAAALNRGVETSVRMYPHQYQWTYRRFEAQPDGAPSPYKTADLES